MRFQGSLIAALVVLLLTHGAAAQPSQTSLAVEIGWGERVRAGRWTPITVKASDPRTRTAVLKVYAPQGGSYAMQVRQYFTLGPVTTTLRVYVPFRYSGMDGPTITISDAATEETLARHPADPEDHYRLSRRVVEGDACFIGVSGNPTSLQNLGNRLGNAEVVTGYTDPHLLPAAAVGYDGLDLLVLHKPDLIRMDVAAQLAILQWVRAGGDLILWPGEDPAPEAAPLVQALPCRIEGSHDYLIADRDARAINLSLGRGGGYRGRLLVPVTGAEEIPLFRDSPGSAYARRHGLGRIIVAPIDLSQLRFSGQHEAGQFWKAVLAGTAALPEERKPAAAAAAPPPNRPGRPFASNSSNGYGHDSDVQRQRAALRTLQNHLANVPGAGQFGFMYVAVVLIGMMVIVGPVDWFVLKMLGRQPWTWATTTGWIALVTLGAIYIGHVFKSGELHYRTVRLVDQIDGGTIGDVSVSFIYSPRTTEYHLDGPGVPAYAPAPGAAPTVPQPETLTGWWEPASIDERPRSGLKTDVDFRQTDYGNAPQPTVINVWNMRFLRGQSTAAGPPMIEASFTYKPMGAGARPHLVGTIRNLTDKPLIKVRVRTGDGYAGPAGGAALHPVAVARIEPGATATFQLALNGNPDLPLAGTTYEDDGEGLQRPATSFDQYGWRLAGDLDARRARRVDALLSRGGYACVYAESPEALPVAVLREEGAKQQHYTLIRAVFPIKTGTDPATTAPAAGGGDETR